ncbi:CCHC-type domain-containing protein [Durusdinium trenchii]|uniref:CCHC-type domain-containing protein n=1 Tax=Durusdinium trenchii TaxID=1381693 RepID=A0ABP0M045_9DINO
MLQALTGKAFEAAKHLIEDDNWRSDDDLAAFRTRFEEAVRKVQKHKVELPSEALGFLFLKQAKVDEETMERLVTLTGGSLKLEAVIDGMRKLKMRLLDPDDDKKRHVWLQDQEHTAAEHVQEADVDDEFHVIEDALQDLDSEDPTAVITEDEAKDVLMTLIRQKIARPAQYSYRQVQQTKQDLRNSRGFRSVNTGSEGRHQGSRTLQMIQEQLPQGMQMDESRKRSCPASAHPQEPKRVSDWSRMFSRLQIRTHCQAMCQVVMGLMMPLMSILIRSFMIETQDPEEEIQALEDTMAVIQTLVDEKKEIQKQEKLERRRRRQERREELQHALMKSEQMSRSSKSSHSFLLVEDTSPSMQFKDKSKKEKKNRSDKKEQMPSGVPLEDMNPEDEAQGLPLNHCFCGLPVTTYVSRTAGANFLRQFNRCPKQIGKQCQFFQWIEPPKSTQHQKLFREREMPTGPGRNEKTKSKASSSKQSRSISSSSSTSSSDSELMPESKAAAGYPSRRPPCQHDWSRKGTNGHQQMLTCKICGRREVTKYSTGKVTVTQVDDTPSPNRRK